MNTSILLGAGFSVPAGYPTGAKLAEMLLGTEYKDVFCHSSSYLSKPPAGYPRGLSHWDRTLSFGIALMNEYSQMHSFDYEEFYDYLNKSPEDQHIAVSTYKKNKYSESLPDLISDFRIVYSQLVRFYLKDKNGQSEYLFGDDVTHFMQNYEQFLKVIKRYSEGGKVFIHTLNHDLLFESLMDSYGEDLSDGFETPSPFMLKLDLKEDGETMNLPYYTGNYHGNYHFFKLHGSVNYGLYFGINDQNVGKPEVYIKSKPGYGFDRIFKQEDDGSQQRGDVPITYRQDVLTGTTSKISRYKEPLLYEKLLLAFQKNLSNSERFVIVGYGGKDVEINNILERECQKRSIKVVIIDPAPSVELEELSKKLNAVLIKKGIDQLEENELP